MDAYNVLRVSLAPEAGEPWWSQARRDLLCELARRLPDPAAEVCLVFDARPLSETREREADAPGEAPGGGPGAHLRVLFTPSADEWIVAAARTRRGEFERVVVVTADRRLADRARHRGAEIVGTGRFLALCRGEA